jgi:hypothetical protein
MATHDDTLEIATLSHPWSYAGRHQVCAGKIALQMKTTERVIAFTFGGDLQVQPQNDETCFTLTSPAPILRLEGFNQISTILANEVEILFAEIRAEELPDLSAYNKRLVCADPFMLYCTCLKALDEKFNDFPYPEFTPMIEFCRFLTKEIDTLHAENFWLDRLPALVDWFEAGR